MGRTKQTARKPTGGKAPRVPIEVVKTKSKRVQDKAFDAMKAAHMKAMREGKEKESEQNRDEIIAAINNELLQISKVLEEIVECSDNRNRLPDGLQDEIKKTWTSVDKFILTLRDKLEDKRHALMYPEMY
jgi:flagellar biosynthesis chaperone FliJ